MKGITFLDEDTVIVKVTKLEQMMEKVTWNAISRLEARLKEKVIDEDRIVTKSEALKLLEISPSTYDNWVRTGKLEAYKIGDKPYLFMSSIKKAMKPIN